MDEEEFDSLLQLRPFGTEEARQLDLRMRRKATLATALWGKTLDELKRQLLEGTPQIPAGFDLTDLRELLQSTEQLASALRNPRNELASRLALASRTILVRGERYTEWEARCEVIRRAIEHWSR
jgi:hypothetical protein